MKSLNEHIEDIVGQMEASKNDTNAGPMKAYMKNHFEFLGIKSPVRKEIQKKWICGIKDSKLDHWDVVYRLWELPYREYQYIALDYLGRMPKGGYDKKDYLKLEELITHKSWWDSVDGLAANCVGQYLLEHPEMIDTVITRWRNSDNIWLNRTCLIFQLRYAKKLNFELLNDLVLQFLPAKEFFIQKAIGWSLRQHSKVDPDAVLSFVKKLELSTVAKREAYKYI